MVGVTDKNRIARVFKARSPGLRARPCIGKEDSKCDRATVSPHTTGVVHRGDRRSLGCFPKCGTPAPGALRATSVQREPMSGAHPGGPQGGVAARGENAAGSQLFSVLLQTCGVCQGQSLGFGSAGLSPFGHQVSGSVAPPRLTSHHPPCHPHRAPR